MNTTVNAPHSTSTHPMERSVWYFIVFGLFTLWVIYDGRRRSMGTRIIPWAVGSFLLGPIVLPIYFAKRPLRTGEVREGGFAWNVLRNFALFWTVLMVVVAISGIVGVANNQPAPTSDAEAAGAAIGTVIGLGLLAVLWFFPMVGALVLGFFLKKSSVIERGPTGPLAQEQRVA